MQPSHLIVGRDVPWVTSWTAEPILGVRRCESVGGRPALAQTEMAGFGKPEYSKNHLLRQRLSVLQMRCPMCGEPTVAGDRWTQVARRVPAGLLRKRYATLGLSVEIEDARIVIDAGAIAPLHRKCSDLSLQHCPHLRSDPNVDVQPFSERWTLIPLMIEARPPVPTGKSVLAVSGAEPHPRAVAVITFLQICGLTDSRDGRWKQNRLRYRPFKPSAGHQVLAG